jgi:GNAT superfamily N-acetyltransferase
MTDLVIRNAEKDDAELVASFIYELAEFEKRLHEAKPDAFKLRQHLESGANPFLGCLIAELDGRPAGFAVYFYAYSTFLTNWGLYLEDIYVRQEYRRQGIAKALFFKLGEIAVAKDCRRLDFNVLGWNEDAIRFYTSLGAVPLTEWTQMRFEGTALANLVQSR